MSSFRSFEERVITRLKEIKNQINQKKLSSAISNIDFFIEYLEGKQIKKRKIVYGNFYDDGTIKVKDILEKIPLQNWVKELKFPNNQRVRIIIEEIGAVKT